MASSCFSGWSCPGPIPGEPVWRLGPLAATRQGIAITALITLKSNAIIIGLMALIATVSVTTLGQAMKAMQLPDKLCHLLLFTYRYSTSLRWNFSAWYRP